MKVVKPNAVYFDHEARLPYQNIELIGRTCYKSEDLIKPGTDVDFVKKLVGRKHWAMLEHEHLFYVAEGENPLMRIEELPAFMLRYVNFVKFKDAKNHVHAAFSASFTGLFQLLQAIHAWQEPDHIDQRQTADVTLELLDAIDEAFTPGLKRAYPEVFDGLESPLTEDTTNSLEPMLRGDYITYVVDNAAGQDESAGVFDMTLPHTIIFTVDRGVTHEMVRHRPASFAQESTRYCNYQKGKYGSEITVVEPAWADDPDKKAALWPLWEQGCMAAERRYMDMLAQKAAPQDARSVLPTSVKNDIVVTAVEHEWTHILDLRLYAKTGAPHPDMLRVMKIAGPQLHANSWGRLCPEMP